MIDGQRISMLVFNENDTDISRY